MDIKTISDFQLWKYFEDQGHQIMIYREQNRTWITFSLEEKTQLVVEINLILVVPVHNESPMKNQGKQRPVHYQHIHYLPKVSKKIPQKHLRWKDWL